MSDIEPSPEELDKVWREAVSTGKPDSVVSLESSYQRTIALAEELLMELRDWARFQMHNERNGDVPSQEA